MKISIFLLFILQIAVSSSRSSSRSVISCALGRRMVPPRDLKIKMPNTTDLNTKAAENVLFYLYTREQPEGRKLDIGNRYNLEASSFNVDRPTKIITHGYLGSRESPSCKLPKNAFLRSGDYNVIIIDWWAMQSIWGSVPMDYWTVAGYVGEVGSYVAAMINFLENHGMKLETTTLIGHSLGAHIMGIAGYRTKNKVNYIVGLDPASPAFENRSPEIRLSVEDADIVETIHTNEGHCGMSYQVGHYDFYPNGGSQQPGCNNNACSHSRAYEFFAESIESKSGFYGRRCLHFDAVKTGECFGDLAMMGGSLPRKGAQNGMFYLKTRDAYPYALGT